jgi:DNA-binding MarR family transcriptional regulator
MKRESQLIEMERLPQPKRLNLAENEMHHLVENLQEGLVHASDRPEIEARILFFLDHASGPTTAGIAAEMGISPEAAAVHLEALEVANRIWSQPSHGAEVTWHIALEGQHFMARRGLR